MRARVNVNFRPVTDGRRVEMVGSWSFDVRAKAACNFDGRCEMKTVITNASEVFYGDVRWRECPADGTFSSSNTSRFQMRRPVEAARRKGKRQ